MARRNDAQECVKTHAGLDDIRSRYRLIPDKILARRWRSCVQNGGT